MSGRAILSAVGAAVVLALLIAAVPRVIAGVIAMPYDPLPDAASGQEQLPRLTRAAAAFESAIDWHDDAAYWGLLAQVHYRIAGTARASDRQEEALQRTVDAQTESLRRQPVDPAGWTRLAFARLRLTGPTDQVATAYRQAIQTGAFVPRLLAPRAAIGLIAEQELDSDLLALADRQLELAALHTPKRLSGVLESPALRRRALQRLAAVPEARCRAAAAFADRSGRGDCGS